MAQRYEVKPHLGAAGRRVWIVRNALTGKTLVTFTARQHARDEARRQRFRDSEMKRLYGPAAAPLDVGG